MTVIKGTAMLDAAFAVAASVKIKEGIYSSGEIVGKYDGKDMPEQAFGSECFFLREGQEICL